ncbi:B12-binding domain-containing radical SAM protein [[Eubacterium] cellulosolvens]
MNPPYSLEDLVGTTKSMKGIMNVVQPLGIGYLAAVLEKNGYDVTVEDCQCLGTSHAELAGILAKQSPDIVGISATTPTFGSSILAASMVKERVPDAIVVIGGAQVCALPEETMSHDCFDVGVWGEGELTMLELAAHIRNHGLKHFNRVKGVVFRHDGSVVQTERRPLIRDLDELPFPARHLLPPLAKYHPAPTSYRRLPNATIMTSRGCAGARCVFCDRSGMGFAVRFRSVENVFDEIEELIEIHGARDLKFFDDTFTLNPKRVFQICQEFERRGIDIPWCCLARTNTVSREMLKAMKDAGCWQLLYGLESMDENVLRNLKKLTTVEQNVRAVEWSHEVGLSVRANFIVGTPFDTWETMEKSLEEAIKLNMDFAHFNKFTPYPGCELYRMLAAQGYHYDPAKWDSQHDMKGTIMYTPPRMTEREYRTWLVKAHRRYYLRPGYILRQLSKIRSVEDFRRLWSGFRAVMDL